jgi:hypothetical protein
MKRKTLIKRPKKAKEARWPMETNEEVILQLTNGREVRLGTQTEYRQAAHEIIESTGGSSGGGAFSALWGVLCDAQSSRSSHAKVRAYHAEMIAQEAACFQSMCGTKLSERARTLLQRLAIIGSKFVVAIGDLHGHYPALEQLLAVMRTEYDLFEHSDPDKLRRGVTLVFTGDYIDRGDHALAIIEKLRKIGATNPGQLVTLLGNHELLALEAFDEAKELSKGDNEEAAIAEYLNVTGHGSNGGDHFIREFGNDTLSAMKSYVARMARNGDIGSWMRTLHPYFETTVARKKILFMHADLSERLHDRKVLDRYLQRVKKHWQVGTADAGGTGAKYGDQILMSSRGIFWNRSFSRLDDANQDGIDHICKSAQVDFLVTGHTCHKAIKAYGNRIFDIDVGMTPLCGGNTPRALMFRSNGIVGFGVDGSETNFVRW